MKTTNKENTSVNTVVHIAIQNLFGLTECVIEPGQVTLLEGGNGAGKSAVLDAVQAAFTIKGIVGEPVTQGATKGTVLLKLKDGTQINRTYSADGKSTVKVLTAAGDDKRSKQSWLDDLFGGQVVNPVSFVGLDDKEKAKVLLSALPIHVTQEDLEGWFGEALPVDTDKHGLEVLSEVARLLYERRAKANSEATTIKNEHDVVVKSIPDDFEPGQWKGLDTSSLTQALQDIGRVEAEKRQMAQEAAQTSHNAGKQRQNANDSEAKIGSIKKDITQLQERIKQLQEQITAYEDLIVNEDEEKGMALMEAKRLDAESDAMSAKAAVIEVPDKSVIEQKLADYSAAQRTLQQIDNRERLEFEHYQATEKADALTTKLELARSKPAELLTQAKFPVEGLEFKDGAITVNGLKLDSLSSGEQLMLGLEVARATVGDLGLIIIDGVEKLDPTNMLRLLEAGKDDPNHHFVITEVSAGALNVRTDVDGMIEEAKAEVEKAEVDKAKPKGTEDVDLRQVSMFDEEEIAAK